MPDKNVPPSSAVSTPKETGHNIAANTHQRLYQQQALRPRASHLRAAAQSNIDARALSTRPQYHPIPPTVKSRLPPISRDLNISDISSPLQHTSTLPEESSVDYTVGNRFDSPPLDPISVATVVSKYSYSTDSEDDKLYMHRGQVSSSAEETPTATPSGSPRSLSPLDGKAKLGIPPKMAVHSKADLDVPPRVLESNDFQNNSDNNNKVHKEQQQQQQAVATSNFDANYIATMGKDNQSIAIRVDSRKRARDLLRRLEGRTESGGILGNLIRLQNTMAGGGGGTQETKKPIKRPLPAAKALAIEGHRSWTSLSGMLRPFTRSKSTDKLHTLHSQGTTTTKQSDQERPVGSPNVLSGAAGADGLPRSFSSARVSALMMTPGALAKNGVIPPPSTHGSLMRSDKRFSSGYFDYYGSPTASPLQSPSLTANHQGSAETTPLLSEEQAELVDRIAGILEKQDFLMHLARAWHAFGSPVHRMEANLLEVSRYLDIDACFFTVPGLTLISFGDPDTHSSETHIVRASDGYDMYRLERANRISRDLRKGRMTVHESLRAIEALLAAPCVYDWYIRVGICFIQSFFVSMTLFYGSWKEALVSGGLGLVVGASELLGERYLMLGYLLNVLPPLVVALVTALLSNWVCFAAVPMAATINLLPGLGLVLSMVELSSGNVICGAVRLVSATMTSFMIGWGTIVGHNLGMAAVGREQSTEIASFSSCAATPMSMWWWFLFVPLSTMGFSIWFRVHWRQWPATIVATALGLVIQSFCDRVHVMRPISPGIASFAVGVFGNLYGRLFHCTTNAAFVFVGIMQLVPGSTGVRGFISLLSEDSSASSLTMTMLSTAISIAVGLLLSNGALYYSELKRFKLGTL